MLKLDKYTTQNLLWPQSGEHILAQFDSDTIVVYQAFNASIADHAVKHQRFCGAFSYARMSWIKPNFLWMMYRSGWATKPEQERILAVRLRREFFDEVMRAAVVSAFNVSLYATKEAWQDAVNHSNVRLQWDPDHGPSGQALTRRAVQLGLRGETLRCYGEDEIVEIEDITHFVSEQRVNARGNCALLVMPKEAVYLVAPQLKCKLESSYVLAS